MRKLTSFLLAAVLLLSCAVTAFAAEGDPVEIGVYAKSEYSIDGEYTAAVENGSASVTTPDGTVSITKAPANAVTLVVIPMKGEALTWIDGCVDSNAVAAYDIHFLGADGNRINANGAKVSIAVSGTELTVSSVDTSGADKQLTSELVNGTISFTTDGSHYYVITKKDSGEEPGPGDTVTVPVRGDENTVHADVTITEEDTVKLHELDFEEIDHVVGDHVDIGVVEIDLTGLGDDITKIVLPVTMAEHILEAAEEAHNNTEALQIDFPFGSVKLDDKTMLAVVEQAECNEVMLVLENVGESRLNDTQQAALADKNVVAGFEAYMVCVSANKRISDFQGGVATLSVPFTVPAGYSESGYTVWHVADNGTLERLTSWFAGGRLHWDVGHFSDFIVTYEGTVETHTVTVKDTQGGKVAVNITTPKAGETVTITVKPDTGKTVDKITVTDETGKTVMITDKGDGTYTFVHPNGDVTVEVTFEDEAPSPAVEYNISIEKTSGGKVEVDDGTPVAGQTVTITTKPNSGKKVNKVTVTDEDGNKIKVADNGDSTYSFVQPDSDVTVKVTFKNQSSGDIPQTGDNSNIWLWLLLLIISFISIVILYYQHRKQRTEK